MYIDDLIKRLQKAQEKVGNVEVDLYVIRGSDFKVIEKEVETVKVKVKGNSYEITSNDEIKNFCQPRVILG